MVKLNLSTAAAIVLFLSSPSLGFDFEALIQARQQTQATGGRKIGIVIDESLSMLDNDPQNLRIEAAKALDESLTSTAEATKEKEADHVSVVGFHSDPDLYYPLGDPSGAIAAISNITSSKSGTFIGGGIGESTDDLTKAGTGTTANRTGIVVLTDGEDNYSGLTGVQGTINAINRAESLGIRVHFGFLSVEATSQDSEILGSILKTGGTFASFDNPEAQKNFIDQVLLKGLTGMDATTASAEALLPGLTTSAILAEEGNKFTYFAKKGETLNLTIQSIDAFVPLTATLRDIPADKIVAENKTDATGVMGIQHTAANDATFELFVKGAGGTGITVGSSNDTDIFSVGVMSSLGLSAGRAPPGNWGTKTVNAQGVMLPLFAVLVGALFFSI